MYIYGSYNNLNSKINSFYFMFEKKKAGAKKLFNPNDSFIRKVESNGVLKF